MIEKWKDGVTVSRRWVRKKLPHDQIEVGRISGADFDANHISIVLESGHEVWVTSQQFDEQWEETP